jgi:tRNA G46 methylase TrmB
MALEFAQPLGVDDVGEIEVWLISFATVLYRHTYSNLIALFLLNSHLYIDTSTLLPLKYISLPLSCFKCAVYDIGCGDGRVLIEMASRSIPFTNEAYDSTQRCEDEQTNSNTEVTSSMQQSTSSIAAATSTTSQQHYCTKFIGIDISPERVTEARNNIQNARTSGHIPPHVSIEIICGNALDTENVDIDYTYATVIFLYLVPRGLRLIKPLIWPKDEEEGGGVDEDKRRVNDDDTVGDLAAKIEEEGGQTTADQSLATTTQQQQQVHKNKSTKRRRRTIITYMSPFEDETYVRKELCRVEHQDGAAWPVYLYHTSC